jgi:2-polyprenyl-3-methyl-5-hydroxy-6-metoxy-1,4-benzoquinol methylase
MDIQEIDKKYTQVRKNYLEYQIKDKEIIEKAITFFNHYYNLVEHSFSLEDVEKISNIDFSIKMDFLHWTTINPKTEDEINNFYRNTPFEFFKNLIKNMDIMHYEEILGKFILPELRKNKTNTILDYGGGSGYQAILLHKLGYKVTFSEINKLSLEWMKYITKENNFDIDIIDLQENKIEKTYDSIILKDVLEHVVNPEALLEMLSSKTKNLIITPDKIEKVEDYLPMHFNYKIQNDS